MFTEAKDDGSGGDNWSYKTCKALVKLSPPTNQHPAFYMLDALPVAQPTVSKHWRKNITFHGLADPKFTWGLLTLSLTTNSPGYLGRVVVPLISSLMPVPQNSIEKWYCRLMQVGDFPHQVCDIRCQKYLVNDAPTLTCASSFANCSWSGNGCLLTWLKRITQVGYYWATFKY